MFGSMELLADCVVTGYFDEIEIGFFTGYACKVLQVFGVEKSASPNLCFAASIYRVKILG